jgi:hypothetical protein
MPVESESEEGNPSDRNPIIGILVGCCASVITATASSITETKIDDAAALFMVHLILAAFYHGYGR